MWINDVERESVGFDVKSIEFTVGCVSVAGGGTATESERTTVFNICHPANLRRKKKKEDRRGRERRREENAKQGKAGGIIDRESQVSAVVVLFVKN